MLIDKLGIFWICEGFIDEKGIVFLEVLFYFRFYLCYKNYYFYLEKEVNNLVFCKCKLCC